MSCHLFSIMDDPCGDDKLDRIFYREKEFAEVFPDSVKDSGEKLPSGESILQVDVHPMMIYAVAAIQQLRAEKDAEIARLRAEKQAENEQLRSRLESLEKLLQHLLTRQQGASR